MYSYIISAIKMLTKKKVLTFGAKQWYTRNIKIRNKSCQVLVAGWALNLGYTKK